MKPKIAYWLAALALVALITLSLLGNASTTALAGGPPKPNGTSYGQWSVLWWQWMYQLPVHTGATVSHPLFVDGPTDCSLGQTGHVWFLGGKLFLLGSNPPPNVIAERSCSIPSGTALFFPLFNAETDYEASGLTPGVDPMPVEPLRQGVAAFIDTVTDLRATVDGALAPNLSINRAQSPVFAYSLPATDNVYQALGASVPGTDWPTTTVAPAVSDGYWLFVPPLSVGQHTITFGYTRVDQGNTYSLDVTYHITVTPGH